MKKAIIDQIMLGFFLFITLIGIGATVSDSMEAKDKYYNLKKVTDDAVLSLAKYYVNVEEDQTDAENVYYEMLKKTKLGSEIKDSITYNWDYNSTTKIMTITASISNYKHNTFWFKYFGLESFILNATSKVTIDSSSPISSSSSGFAPFAVNSQSFTIGNTFNITYELVANLNYSHKNTFYPIIANCDCNCSFMLSNNFNYSNFSYNVNSCSSEQCTTHGESDFLKYSKQIDDVYTSDYSINFDSGTADTSICLMGTYLGNANSSWATQINHLSTGLSDLLTAAKGFPFEMDLITLDSNAKGNGIVRVQVTKYNIVDNGNPNGRYITLETKIVPIEKIKLVD